MMDGGKRGLAGDFGRILVATAGIDGEEAVAKEAQDFAAVAVEWRSDRIEKLIQRIDVGLPSLLLRVHGRFTHIRHDEGGSDGLTIATANLSVQNALAGIAAEIGGEHEPQQKAVVATAVRQKRGVATIPFSPG